MEDGLVVCIDILHFRGAEARAFEYWRVFA